MMYSKMRTNIGGANRRKGMILANPNKQNSDSSKDAESLNFSTILKKNNDYSSEMNESMGSGNNA